MQASDIVEKLSARMPLYTEAFSESVVASSIVPTGSTALATTASPHGLVEGQAVAVIGADAPVEIDKASFLRVTTFATFETLQDHDLTLSARDKVAGGKTITLSGATESEFNGTFNLVDVINRRKLIITVVDSGPTTISGAPIFEDANGGIFNGIFSATNITASTFEYTLPISYPLPASGLPVVQISIRVLSVIDVDQYLRDAYTKQLIGDDHLVVTLGDVSQSKDRNETTDASMSTAGQRAFQPTIIQTFAVYIITNTTQELSASVARDNVESVIIPAIFKSILREEFDCGFSTSQFRATFTGHGVYAYSDELGKNKAIYVHEVAFEQLAKLYESDVVGPVDNVAMRDVSFTISSNIGTEIMTADIDLDQEPI